MSRCHYSPGRREVGGGLDFRRSFAVFGGERVKGRSAFVSHGVARLLMNYQNDIPQLSQFLQWWVFVVNLLEDEFSRYCRRKVTFVCSFSLLQNTDKSTSHAANSKLFVNIFPARCENIWRVINTVASIWREVMLMYLPYNITTCPSRLTVFRVRSSRKTVCI